MNVYISSEYKLNKEILNEIVRIIESSNSIKYDIKNFFRGFGLLSNCKPPFFNHISVGKKNNYFYKTYADENHLFFGIK